MTTWAATQWTAYRLGLPAPAWAAVVRAGRLADLAILRRSSGGGTSTMPTRPPIFVEAALHRSLRRLHRHRRGDRHVGLASARGQECRDLRLSPMGALGRGCKASGAARPDGVVLGEHRARLSPPRRPGACAALRPDAIRQGGAGLVVLRSRPGRARPSSTTSRGELDADGWLSIPPRPRAAVRSDECEVGGLQPAARGAARGVGSPRRAEYRRHSRRPGRGRSSKQNHREKTRRTRSWSARSCTSSTPRPTRPWPESPLFLSDPKRPIESTLAAMMKTASPWRRRPASGDRQRRPRTPQQNRQRANRSAGSTARSFLDLYRDPAVAEVTTPPPLQDWRIVDIVARSKHPTTLYLVVPPSDIIRNVPLIRLILNQVGRRLTEDLQARGQPPSAACSCSTNSRRSAGSTSSRAPWRSGQVTA